MCGTSYADRPVEDRVERVDVGDLPVGADLEAVGLVHPGVDRDDGKGAPEPRDHHRDAGPEVGPPGEPLPAEDVDRDEDRLGEEEDALDREREPEDLPEATGELRPQEAELERQDGAGDGAHREQHGRDLRPALGELQRDGIVVSQAPVVGDQHHRGEGDADRGQDDVEPERERHLAPRRSQLGGDCEQGGQEVV